MSKEGSMLSVGKRLSEGVGSWEEETDSDFLGANLVLEKSSEIVD